MSLGVRGDVVPCRFGAQAQGTLWPVQAEDDPLQCVLALTMLRAASDAALTELDYTADDDRDLCSMLTELKLVLDDRLRV